MVPDGDDQPTTSVESGGSATGPEGEDVPDIAGPTLPGLPSEPEVGVYALVQFPEYEGRVSRFNPCDAPVRIRFNPDGHMTSAQAIAVDVFLGELAAALSTFLEMGVEYAGRTLDDPAESPDGREEILLFFGPAGTGIFDDIRNTPDKAVLGHGRRNATSVELERVDVHVDSSFITRMFDADGTALSRAGEWYLMHTLGRSVGLETLGDSDFPASQEWSVEQKQAEIMYWDWDRLVDSEWGPGDRQGLAELGTAGGCIETFP